VPVEALRVTSQWTVVRVQGLKQGSGNMKAGVRDQGAGEKTQGFKESKGSRIQRYNLHNLEPSNP
jgi:hypothetical protein|tara:strand:- start:4886 stop:5080 length:195 start_codon:yes stop_codon:yes gene_type:complete